MSDMLRRVLWTAGEAFLAAFLVLAPGVAQAPNLKTARALLVAAFVAGVSAALSALKNAVVPPGSPAR